MATTKVTCSMSRSENVWDNAKLTIMAMSGVGTCLFGNKERRVDGYPLTSSSADPFLHHSAQLSPLVFYPTLVDSAGFQAALILR
jgi:hypothetical protein